MDGIFSIFILFGIISFIGKLIKGQKAPGQAGQASTPEQPWKRMLGDVAKQMDEAFGGKPAMQPAKLPPTVYRPMSAAPAQSTRASEAQSMQSAMGGSIPYFNSGEGSGSLSMPSLEGVSAPLEPLPTFRGSMTGTLDEAYSSSETSNLSAIEQELSPSSTFRLNLDRDSLVNAIVMQEVLTRPQDRRRRWSTH